MPKKNDLSAFKTVAPDKPRILEQPKPEPKRETRGRKKKPIAEKETELISFKVTKSEKERVLERADLVPLGTFIKHQLRTKTDVFE